MVAVRRKSRKSFFKAPHHLKSVRICAHLSDDLHAKYRLRSARVRKGDGVKVMRGEYAGVEGKVTEIYMDSGRLAVEGVTREKIAGGTVPIKIHASKVMITSLNLDDKWRRRMFEEREVKAQVG